MGMPFEVYIDGRIVRESHRYTAGRILKANVLPKDSLDPELQNADKLALSLFVFPYSEVLEAYELSHRIKQLEGKSVNMGRLPHMVVYRQPSLSVELKRGNVYDILAVAEGLVKGNISMAGGVRFSTQRGFEVPYAMTLEEMKYLDTEELGLNRKQAKKVRATLVAGGAWGEDGVRYTVAMFTFAPNVGSMVNHQGDVLHYGGWDSEGIRQVLKV